MFYDRINGKPSIHKNNQKKQHLTPAEEQVLVAYILGCADRGLPMDRDGIVLYANAILEKEGSKAAIKPSSNWIDRFLLRHSDKLHTHWSKPLESQRARALNPDIIRHWYQQVLKPHVVEREDGKEVLDADLYGMDEIGCPLTESTDQGTKRVVGCRETKTQHRVGGGNRENITVIVTICADGTKLKPMIIYKGKNL